MKKLRDIMRPGFLTSVQRDATVAEAVRAMATNNVGIVAVLVLRAMAEWQRGGKRAR